MICWQMGKTSHKAKIPLGEFKSPIPRIHQSIIKQLQVWGILWIFYSFSAFRGVLKNCPCFLGTLSGWDLLKFLFSHDTKQGIQCSTVEICSFDLLIIPRRWWINRFGPSNHTFSSKDYQKKKKNSHAYLPVCIVSTIK